MDTIYQGDAFTVLKTLPDQCVQTCVTSPPYWGLRDYGVDGQIGLEETPQAFTEIMVGLFQEVRRVLRNDGTLWLNLGDSYASGNNSSSVVQSLKKGKPSGAANVLQKEYCPSRKSKMLGESGLKSKDMVGIPWRVALALQADGWYLRQDIIWHKPNPLPESVRDRCTKAHEYIFLLSKSERYYFDAGSIKEPLKTDPQSIKRKIEQAQRARRHEKIADAHVMTLDRMVANSKAYAPTARNKRSVWTVGTKPYTGGHFATFPPDLIRPCILAGAPTQHTVLDPFLGSGTTAMVAKELNRHYLGIELNPDYIELAKQRLGIATQHQIVSAAE